MLGKLSQVGMVVLAGLPVVAFLAPLDGLGLGHLSALIVLLAAVAARGRRPGRGGIRGLAPRPRCTTDVYISDGLAHGEPAPGLARPAASGRRLCLSGSTLISSMIRLVWAGDTVQAPSRRPACWATLGLWPAPLWRSGGFVRAAFRSGSYAPKPRSRKKAPPVRERPMLWKELFIERVASLGRFGRWLGVLLTIGIGGGSLVLGGMIVYRRLFFSPNPTWSRWHPTRSRLLLGGFAGTLLGWLLAVGRRPAGGGFDRLGARAQHLGRPLDEPAQTRPKSPWPNSPAAFMRCATWPPPCCWPGRWRPWWGP